MGGTGATGIKLLRGLLERDERLKLIVRSRSKLPELLKNSPKVEVLEGNVLDMPEEELSLFLKDCRAVASCLGHSPDFKGIFGKPRNLVSGSVQRIAQAIAKSNPGKPVHFVLMNTAGNRYSDLGEKLLFKEKVITTLLRLCVPPFTDNIEAANYLREEVGRDNPYLKWVIVRPDTLLNADEVTAYEVHPSAIYEAIFNAGRVSRINVSDFMAELISDANVWEKWEGQMPVLYNAHA